MISGQVSLLLAIVFFMPRLFWNGDVIVSCRSGAEAGCIAHVSDVRGSVSVEQCHRPLPGFLQLLVSSAENCVVIQDTWEFGKALTVTLRDMTGRESGGAGIRSLEFEWPGRCLNGVYAALLLVLDQSKAALAE
jgi:hypothetical protein